MRGFPIFAAVVLCLGAGMARAATTIEVGPGVCDTLVNYVPEPGVEYQPGVDASGNPVVPADVGERPPLKFPTHFVIPITEYLAARLTNGGQTGQGTLSPQAMLGTVTVDNGHLAFNGQPIGDDVDGELAQLCQKARAGVR